MAADGDRGRRAEARRLFGEDAQGYAGGRPRYPAEVYDLLAERCGLAPGTRVLEIGPGGGQATEDLLARGASPLVAVEPDGRLAAIVEERFGDDVGVVHAAFEDADLGGQTFDLACSATAWHWVDQRAGLAKLARVVRPGGAVALWWTAFHDPEPADDAAPDPLFEALAPLLLPLPFPPSPSPDGTSSAFAFAREAREADLHAAGFEGHETAVVRWALHLDPPGARALYGTFSRVLSAPPAERERVLSAIERIVAEDFGGSAERRCVTIVHTARRC